jgi:hypothetical protein
MTPLEPLPEPSTDPAELQAALEALAATDRLLVALDFDGTLAPTVDRPEDARAVPAAREAIQRLVALEDTWVAYVSGRALDSLIHVSEPDDKILLIGSHGVEVRLDDPDAEASLTPEESARAAEVERLLDQIAAVYDNVWVERKPAGFALHTRRAADDVALEAGKRALAELSLPGVTIRDGKDALGHQGRRHRGAASLHRRHGRALCGRRRHRRGCLRRSARRRPAAEERRRCHDRAVPRGRPRRGRGHARGAGDGPRGGDPGAVTLLHS